VVAGRVLDPDTEAPVANAAVTLMWTDVKISKETGITRTPHELNATTDSSGFFKFCGVSDALDASVQAGRSGVWTGEVAVSTAGAPLTFEDLALASSREARRKGVVRGVVHSLDDAPIGGARVEAPMFGTASVTKEDGTFTLEGIPTGTNLIIVRRIGFEPARITINVTSRQPTELRIVLGPAAAVMDTVFVTARRNYVLDKTGFLARERAGWGRYFTHADVEKRNPQHISDLLRDLPGIQVRYGVGGAVVTSSRMPSILGGGRSCTRIWVDGTEWRAIEPGDIDMFVSPRELVGLEIYQPGQAPAQYRDIKECITVLMWTEMARTTKAR
jgi:hypothetical protein